MLKGVPGVNQSYELVRLANGSASVRSIADGETFHPVAGPIAEADTLYVRQLRLRERSAASRERVGLLDEFIIWDVGLGAGGNVLTAIRRLDDLPARIRILSFDRTMAALRFALSHAGELKFPLGFEVPIEQLLEHRTTQFVSGNLQVHWEAHSGNFPSLLTARTDLSQWPPDAIFFDAFSPARNPEMWTLPLFENLFSRLERQRPCSLATFSRSTMARVALLLAGFFVGAGDAVAGKEETTVAANFLELIDRPLDWKWLERAWISRSAEPLAGGAYRQAPLSESTRERLRAHPQFVLNS